MKILVSGRHTNKLQDIRAAVAAAAKAEGNSKMSARVTVEDMKAGSSVPFGGNMAAVEPMCL